MKSRKHTFDIQYQIIAIYILVHLKYVSGTHVHKEHALCRNRTFACSCLVKYLMPRKLQTKNDYSC